MATVDSWFRDFVERHVERIPRADWPAPSSEFWTMHKAAFIRHGITERVADEASILMAEAGGVFPDANLKTFLESVKTVAALDRAAAAATAGPMSRDAARAASKDCPIGCGGEGLVTRYRRDSAKPGMNNGVVMYCTCAAGRWIKAAHANGGEAGSDVAKRIPDLADFPRLQSWEFNMPPRFDDAGTLLPPEHDAIKPGRRAMALLGQVPEPTPETETEPVPIF